MATSLTRVLLTNRCTDSEASRSARAASVARRNRPQKSISQNISNVPSGLNVSLN